MLAAAALRTSARGGKPTAARPATQAAAIAAAGAAEEAVAAAAAAAASHTSAARLHHRTSVAAGTIRRRLPTSLTEPSRSTLRKLQDRGAGLFDGAVYAGSAGVEVGLVDAIGEISSDMCKRFGRHVQLVNMEPEEPVDYGRLLRWLF